MNVKKKPQSAIIGPNLINEFAYGVVILSPARHIANSCKTTGVLGNSGFDGSRASGYQLTEDFLQNGVTMNFCRPTML